MKQKIAGDLEQRFSELGFAGQGVEAPRAGADVSIRTLDRHFPSREAMVLGALKHRDRAYFDWLASGPQTGGPQTDEARTGAAHVLHPIFRQGDWLGEVANTGCLFMTALAEHRESTAIAAAVRAHKARLADEFNRRLKALAPDRETDQLAETLFLLHEGMTQTARLHRRDRATTAALAAARAALAAEGIT